MMEFHPGKCQVIHVTNKIRSTTFTYEIHDVPLETTPIAKYLGLLLHKKLSWKEHINTAAKKADGVRAFLQRNMRTCPPKVKKQCYTTLVRPMLEYGSVIWDPHIQVNINRLEAVQRRAVRFIVNDYSRSSSVTKMLQKLDIPTLEVRRAQARVTMMYRIVNSLIEIPDCMHLLQPRRSRSRRSNNHSYVVPFFRLVCHQKSFFPDTIRLWNFLPDHITDRIDLDTFKRKVQSMTLRE